MAASYALNSQEIIEGRVIKLVPVCRVPLPGLSRARKRLLSLEALAFGMKRPSQAA